MQRADSSLANSSRSNSVENRLRTEDRAVHQWYRLVLSFPPHLVRKYLGHFNIGPGKRVLDPFCGTGTTLVECKKRGIGSVGVESNPIAHFASSVKVDWSVDADLLTACADEVAFVARQVLEREGIVDGELPLFATGRCTVANGGPASANHQPAATNVEPVLRRLGPEQTQLLLKNSISPLPLHKILVLLEAIDNCGVASFVGFGRLALANALVQHVSNLKFGPEVGVGKIRKDAPVVDAWLAGMRSIMQDLERVRGQRKTAALVHRGDSRQADSVVVPNSIDAVITSPPYPNEKDYTRTTRLETVILGLARNRQELRSLKQGLVRSNTRCVYKSDVDDREVADNQDVNQMWWAIRPHTCA